MTVLLHQLATSVLCLHAFLLLSTTVLGTDGHSFPIPVKIQPHYATQSDEEQLKQVFKHENNGTMLTTTAKKSWWRRKGKNKEARTKDTTINEGTSSEIVTEVTGDAAVAIPLHKDNVAIVGTISLGSQSFEVMFDTGSSSLWVFGKRVGKARKFEMGHEEQKLSEFDHRFYDEDLSADTLKLSPTPDVFKTSYDDGCVVSGRLGTEHLRVGTVLLEDMQFGITDTLDGPVPQDTLLDDGPEPQDILYDGILGLGFDPMRASTFASRIMTERGGGLKNMMMYSVYMSEDGRTGEIMIGGSNQELYKGPVHFANVVAAPAHLKGPCTALASSWCVLVEKIGFAFRHEMPGSKKKEEASFMLIEKEFSFDPEDGTQYPYTLVDTGTTYIEIADAIASKISAVSGVLRESFLASGKKYLTFPCKALKHLPTLRIKIGGKYLELTPQDYSHTTTTRNRLGLKRKKCELLIRPDPQFKGVTLGAPFFKKYYTMFMGQASAKDTAGKPHQIGFALSAHAHHGSGDDR